MQECEDDGRNGQDKNVASKEVIEGLIAAYDIRAARGRNISGIFAWTNISATLKLLVFSLRIYEIDYKIGNVLSKGFLRLPAFESRLLHI